MSFFNMASCLFNALAQLDDLSVGFKLFPFRNHFNGQKKTCERALFTNTTLTFFLLFMMSHHDDWNSV